MLAAGHTFRVPDITDYEVRRELSRSGRLRSVVQLNRLRRQIGVAPVTAQAWLKAAELWAVARRVGRPTADDRDLDADVILAATALTYPTSEPVIVATDNARHLARFCDARHRTEID
jgi:predicted nucleic acid-binding protein